MKLGLHCFLFTDHWSDDNLEILDTARSLSAECFEIVVGDDIHFTPRLTRQRAEALGMDLTIGPGGLWPMACDLSADDPADRAAGLAWHCKQVDLATAMDAVAYTGALYGHPGQVQRRVPPADEYPRTAEGLHRLAEYAAGRGVTIALEPMSHFRTHIANTPKQIMRLIALADHPNLVVLLDTYHLITEVRDYDTAIRAVGAKLWGLHACENDRGVPGGGLVPWGQVFAALKAITFDGYLMLEAYNSSLGDFAYRRAMFHNVCPDGVAFAETGLRFFRQSLEHAGMTLPTRRAPTPASVPEPSMARAELLRLFDREQRREIEFPNIRREITPHTIRHVVLSGMPGGAFVLYSQLDEGNANAAIDSEIAYFESLALDFEWKAYDHDTPADLVDRLKARGFEIEEPEAVMVLELAHAPDALWRPVTQDVRRLTDPAQLAEIAQIQEAVWGEKFDWLARALADEMAADGQRIQCYLAYADGVPACAAWIRFHPPTQFASLWGGSTLPAYRKRGLYTAILAVRAQEARRRGCRFLTIDASPMSRPIAEKHGFQFLTHAHACNWHARHEA